MTDQYNVCLSVSFTTDIRPQKRQAMQKKKCICKTYPTYTTRKHTFPVVLQRSIKVVQRLLCKRLTR